MAHQNMPNGMPPQMMDKPLSQYNGVHSSHSSRDSSPSTRYDKSIPVSQLPPRPAIPPSQLPPSRSPNITQQMGQMNINSKFNTSTPNETLQNSSGLVNSAFSPINLNSAPKNQPYSQTPPPSTYNYPRQVLQPISNQAPPLINNQGHGRLPVSNQAPVNNLLNNQAQPLVSNQRQAPPSMGQPPVSGQGQIPPPPGANQGQGPPRVQPPVSQGQVLPGARPPVSTQGQAPPLIGQAPPVANSLGAPLMINQGQGQLRTQPPVSQGQALPVSTQGQAPPLMGQAPPVTNSLGAPLMNNQGQGPLRAQPSVSQGQAPPLMGQAPPVANSLGAPLMNNQGQAPHLVRQPVSIQGQVPLSAARPPVINQTQPPSLVNSTSAPFTNNQGQASAGYNYNSSPGLAQPKANLHSNRYPQPPPPQPTYQRPTNYQQPPQQVYQQPQQQVYQQQNSVAHSGFNKLWGHDHFDLLQNPNVLPREKVQAPRVYLGNEILDSANCSPDVFRCTMTKIPESNSLLQKSRLPLGILIHPFKDLTHLPVIQCNVIVRCRACRTYINPFVFFVDTKRWKCNLCYRVNELPEEFQFDPVSKTYGDPTRRPEIKSSTIEYIAPAEYMLRPPQPAVYLFLFDISRLAIESGYLQSACAVLLEELKNLPGDARTQVGIICYDSALHFFAMGDGLSQPHEMTVLEIDDVFLPSPDNLLVNLKDRNDLLTDLLTQLPTRFNNSYDNNSALGAALQAAHKMMGATGGRVSVFQASLPNVGPGALNPREDPSQRASTEVQHLNPANDFYKRLALECSGQQIAVDLFVINSQYVDMATISGISRFSGGCIHHFPLFKASRVIQNERFERCFRRYLIRKIGFEAVMRIRCTRGLSIHTFHGNFFVRSTDLLSLPNVSPDAAFGMQVSIDESLSDVQSVCFQAALLYTSSKGERRIRVHTLCLPICATLSDVINAADQQCIIGLLAKMAVDRSMQSSLSDAREAFINVAIDILSSYKLSLNMGEGHSSLLAPQCLRLLPLYISALLKSTAFRTGTCTRLDDRVKAMIDMKTKPLCQLIQSIYPDLYPVYNLDEQPVILNSEDEPIPQPPHLQLTARCLDSKGAFLMDTGIYMILLVCPGVSPVFLNEALGVRDYVSISDEMYELPILDNLQNQRLHQFISFLNEEKPWPATLHVIRDNSPNRIEFFERLIEDRVENALSYHEFMQHLKTQVK